MVIDADGDFLEVMQEFPTAIGKNGRVDQMYPCMSGYFQQLIRRV
jgi:hypothetical protein